MYFGAVAKSIVGWGVVVGTSGSREGSGRRGQSSSESPDAILRSAISNA